MVKINLTMDFCKKSLKISRLSHIFQIFLFEIMFLKKNKKKTIWLNVEKVSYPTFLKKSVYFDKCYCYFFTFTLSIGWVIKSYLAPFTKQAIEK